MADMTYALKVERSGRVLLPAQVRKRLGLRPGEDVLVDVSDDGVRVLGTREAVLREVQQKLRPYRGRRDVVSELLSERRAEARTE